MRNILSKTLLLALVGCSSFASAPADRTASAMDQQNAKTVNPDVAIIVDRMVDRVVAQDFRQKVQGFIKKIKDPIADQLFSVHLIMMADKRACDSGSVTHAALIEHKQDLHAYFVYIADKISETLADVQSGDSLEQAGKSIIADVTQRLVAESLNFTTQDRHADSVAQIYKELEELLKEVSSNLSVDHVLLRAIPAEIARQEQSSRRLSGPSGSASYDGLRAKRLEETQAAREAQEADEALVAQQEQFRKKYEKIYYAQLPDEQLEEVRNEEIRNIARDQRSANEAAMQEVARIEQERIAQEAHDALVAQQERERIAQQEAEAARLKQERIVQQKAHEALVAQQKKERIAQQEAEAARLEQERIAQQVAKALAAQQERERIAQQKAHQVQRERELIEIASQEHEKAMKKQEDKIAAKAALAQQKEQESQRAQAALTAQQKEELAADEKERAIARSKREAAASSSSLSSAAAERIKTLQRFEKEIQSMHGKITGIPSLKKLIDTVKLVLPHLSYKTRQWIKEHALQEFCQVCSEAVLKMGPANQVTAIGKESFGINLLIGALCHLININRIGLLDGASDDEIDKVIDMTIATMMRAAENVIEQEGINILAGDESVVDEKKQGDQQTRAMLRILPALEKEAEREMRKTSNTSQDQIAGLKKIIRDLLLCNNCSNIDSLRQLRQHGQVVADLLQGTSKELFLMHCLNLVDGRINAAPAPGDADKDDINKCAKKFIKDASSIILRMCNEMSRGASDEEVAAIIERMISGMVAQASDAESSASASSK